MKLKPASQAFLSVREKKGHKKHSINGFSYERHSGKHCKRKKNWHQRRTCKLPSRSYTLRKLIMCRFGITYEQKSNIDIVILKLELKTTLDDPLDSKYKDQFTWRKEDLLSESQTARLFSFLSYLHLKNWNWRNEGALLMFPVIWSSSAINVLSTWINCY